jgi:hypothetical protein
VIFRQVYRTDGAINLMGLHRFFTDHLFRAIICLDENHVAHIGWSKSFIGEAATQEICFDPCPTYPCVQYLDTGGIDEYSWRQSPRFRRCSEDDPLLSSARGRDERKSQQHQSSHHPLPISRKLPHSLPQAPNCCLQAAFLGYRLTAPGRVEPLADATAVPLATDSSRPIAAVGEWPLRVNQIVNCPKTSIAPARDKRFNRLERRTTYCSGRHLNCTGVVKLSSAYNASANFKMPTSVKTVMALRGGPAREAASA